MDSTINEFLEHRHRTTIKNLIENSIRFKFPKIKDLSVDIVDGEEDISIKYTEGATPEEVKEFLEQFRKH